MNVALNKRILEKESWQNSEVLTNGNITNYNSSVGYAHTSYPEYCTLDLEKTHNIKFVRFLLWDKDARFYKYRLLTSKDNITWNVIYDSGNCRDIGWQAFNFLNCTTIRYVRIHALHNSVNPWFHIVEIEAYDGDNYPMYKHNQEQTVDMSSQTYIEIKDGFSTTRRLIEIANQLENTTSKTPGLDKDYFAEIISDLRIRIEDVSKIEATSESITRQILKPITIELTRSNKLGNLSIFLGIIGGVLSIFSILNIIFKWLN